MRAMKLLVAVGLVLCTGCAGLGKYAKERGNDFLDCFQAHGGYGVGADVHVRATRLIAAGAGGSWSRQWGMDGRDFVETDNTHIGPPVSSVYWALLGTSRQAREGGGEHDNPIADVAGPVLLGLICLPISLPWDACVHQRRGDGRAEGAWSWLGIALSAGGSG